MVLSASIGRKDTGSIERLKHRLLKSLGILELEKKSNIF